MFNETTNGDWNSPYNPLIQAVCWFIAATLSLGTILGNELVLHAYRIEHSISRQLNNRFIVSLAVSDLIIGIEGIPFFTVYVINGDLWPLGPIACEIWLFLDYSLCLISILTVLLITVDRYLSVCYTASYIKWQTTMRIQILIFSSWLLPCLFFGLMIFGWPLMGSIQEQIQATSNGQCYAPFLSNPFVNMSMYLVYYWTTLIAMLILYKGIHKAAKKLEKKSKAREHRHIALLLTQRLGTQVGVGLMLHARRYHEEALNSEKQQLPTIEVKDSGYTTNNTLSTTTETTERRRSSFGILSKAVQSSQRFRGRGFSVFNLNNANVKEDLEGNKRCHLKIQIPQLERLSEDNNSTTKTAKEMAVEEENKKLLNNDAEDQHFNKSLFAHKNVDRLISLPFNSLSTEVFHEESLTSLLNFCPSMNETPLESSSTSIASKIKGKFQKNLNLKSNLRKIKRHNSLNILHISLSTNILRSNSLGRKLPIFAQIKQTNVEQKTVSNENFLLNKKNSGQQCLSLNVSIKPEDNQQKTSESPTNSNNTNNSRRSQRATLRKRQRSIHNRLQPKKQTGPQSYLQITADALGRLQQQFSGLILSGLGLTNNEERISKQNFSMHFSPSFSIFLHQLNLGSKNIVSHCQNEQKQVPKLLVTRYSLTPQNDATNLIEENKEINSTKQEEKNVEQNLSSKFLQTLFSPISIFQRKRKKTKAERRAQKAFRTITFIVGLFAILWSPYYVVATIYGFCRGNCIPMFLYNLSYYMCYLNSSLNPFAYALANRQFRSAFLKILRGNFRKTNCKLEILNLKT
ncbi:G_PROTEIN_RECEP_F1_2 domain-containing protein [Meloidogyne graminicola]|uniref:G_PROTEIN_RECEP_F1_2 domain-containing protein n=1 Tax=Meloidogyne graminicola TaxID=189291 RepID=A0A8S9ZYV5_9BILA|nr:G_PROTEIN_RECEP_F1_2 domain-containing protein [Meloidogyne graminicola]